MLKKPVIYVNRITNLSDARYCAGMGVDILGFSIDPSDADYVNAKAYQEMVGWISGPKRAVEVTDPSPVNWDQIVEDYKPDFIHINYDLVTDSLPDIPVILQMTFEELTAHGTKLNRLGINLEMIVVNNLPSTINKEDVTIDPHPVLLFLEEEREDLNNYLESTGAAGIALQGTPEQAPGLKDYDHLARVLEQLEME